MKRMILGLALVAAAFISGSRADAQFTLVRSVVGNGGQPMSNASFVMDGTVGQATIGFVSNASFSGSIGFWFTPTNVGGVEDAVALTGGNRLEQNFPNPFRGTTRIKFTLVQPADVTLKVYNTAGEEIATIVSGEEMEAGDHEVLFSKHDLASGNYLCQLQIGKYTLQRQMLAIK
ncbi:MAG: Peptidase in kexin sedolisin [Chlorobi bacterium]|nr:Peptidase in kexin sedolisin [Chlorobiota bacterium]